METHIIYKATSNTTGLSYIGYTNKLSRRKALHKFAAKNGSATKFHQAIRKFGFEDFAWTILFEGKSKDICFLVEEPKYIKMFNTIKNGYNVAQGGNRSYRLTTEMKCNLNNGRKGKTLNELYGVRAKQIRDKLRISLKQHYKSNPNIRRGLNNTNADKKKHSFVNSKTGQTFEGTRHEFFMNHNFSPSDRSNMCQVMKGNLNHCKGWKLIEIQS